ncbi:MAG TPA: ABC transporter ATP-binding protein [Acidimicrobiia bacterium]|nr:ABC transporter ATP-binding protein [Acidimicrobiia bacterium]
MSKLVVEAEGISKRYPGVVPVDALHPCDLSVFQGEMVALEGPSGSGKSTMLGLLGLLDTPTRGSVRMGREDTSVMGDRARSRLRAEMLGFVFQQFNLVGHLTARANVETALLFRQFSRRQRRDLASEVLDKVGLGDRLDHRPAQLSGGEQQRVSLARAIVNQPRLILADEPTGNLDTESTETVLDLLEAFVAEGVAVVVATHDPLVSARTHRRIKLRDGRMEG